VGGRRAEERFVSERGPGAQAAGADVLCERENEFTAILQRADGCYLAFSPEMPAANGQDRTREEALESLASAIDLVLRDLREESFSQDPPGTERAVVRVG
jgi:predicted RNase H-like HicB family nuclease